MTKFNISRKWCEEHCVGPEPVGFMLPPERDMLVDALRKGYVNKCCYCGFHFQHLDKRHFVCPTCETTKTERSEHVPSHHQG